MTFWSVTDSVRRNVNFRKSHRPVVWDWGSRVYMDRVFASGLRPWTLLYPLLELMIPNYMLLLMGTAIYNVCIP